MSIFFDVKTDFRRGRLRGRWGRVQNLHDALQEIDNGDFVNVQTGFEFCLERCQLAGQLTSIGQHRAPPHKGTDNKNAHLGGTGTVQHVGGHDGAVLGEGTG